MGQEVTTPVVGVPVTDGASTQQTYTGSAPDKNPLYTQHQYCNSKGLNPHVEISDKVGPLG